MSQTGENEQALRKILDMTRLISIVLLGLHFYYYFYGAFRAWGLVSAFSDRLLAGIAGTGLFSHFLVSKSVALGLLCISLIGSKGKKSEKLRFKDALHYTAAGLLIYFASYLAIYFGRAIDMKAALYFTVTGAGYLLVLKGGTILSRIITDQLTKDIFNTENQTFPQEERLLENEYSINLPAKYQLKKKVRSSVINIVSPQRASLICGSPGAGKTAYVIRQYLIQALGKNRPYTAVIYDFKYPDLSLIAYNHWLRNKHRYGGTPGFYVINFDDLTRSNRCNVFDALGMTDITDATESARTILLGLNREWQKKTGDFFVESSVNFVTAAIWFLRKYQDGQFCTLPHVIELIQTEYDKLFTVLQTDEISALVNPFINAYMNDAVEQLEGQIASAKIALARLASPQLYYVLSGNDFTLDINNPQHPKVVCFGNNPQKTQTYGAVLSLYMNRLLKIINQKGKEKSMLVLEEFPTITLDVIPTIATGRSNKIAVCLCIQDATQLRKEYGREQADVILNTVGNIISGQVTGDSAKQISEQIGKIMQDRESLSINRADTSISRSLQLEYAVPPSKISGLSSGEFVGRVADTPDQKIQLKAFHCEIKADFDAIRKEEEAYLPVPVIRQVDEDMVLRNYHRIKQEVRQIIDYELERIAGDPALAWRIVGK